MKKIVASVGLVALGASGLSSVSAQSVAAPAPSKPWSVSATLRGFYDDNFSTIGNDAPLPPGQKRDSFGFEFSPTASLIWSVEQTTLSVGYLYSLQYYENKPLGSSGHDQQTHTFNVDLNHAFSERYRVRVSDSFVLGQEPDLLRAGNTFATFQYLSGNNIRNYGVLGFDAQLTPQLGVGLGYDNAFYDYAGTFDRATGIQPTPLLIDPSAGTIIASPAGVLNRIENGAHVEALWGIQPETKAIIGYRFQDIDYNGNEFISGTLINRFGPVDSANLLPAAAAQFFGLPGPVQSSERNSRTHVVYVGAEHNFRRDLTGAARVGASYTDYYNSSRDPSYSPYLNMSLRWTYGPESYLEGGAEYRRSATDVIGGTGFGYALDQEAATVFASINHRITPKIFGSAIAQFQNSAYNGGIYNNESDQYYLLGLNLEYRFNQFLAADVGYNYDLLQSDIPLRKFDRNRVYIGVTASY